jgi:hypothetical protein
MNVCGAVYIHFNSNFALKKETLYVSSTYGVLSFDVTFDENAEPRAISKVLFQ